MELSGEAIILSVHKFAEHGAVVRLFSRDDGLISGVCKQALASKHRGIYQPGNRVHFSRKARLAEHLGTIGCELVTPIAALAMHDKKSLLALGVAVRLCQMAMHEHDPHPGLYDTLRELLMQMALGEHWDGDYVRFEWQLLCESGFGPDVSACVATGQTDDLAYVSPKSGGAVCRQAGLPYHDKLLPLPAFLLDDASIPSAADWADGMRTTGYFLHHWLLAPHGKSLPTERQRLMDCISSPATALLPLPA